jgi:uncharacterized transporter YbjL
VVPLPITCFLARAPLAATVFLGTFVGVVVRIMTFPDGGAPLALAWWLLGAKVGDLIVGLFITRMRHRVAPAAANSTT